MTDYDIIEYPHRPFGQLQPDRFAVLGAMFGMTPRDPACCRVLELGCGSGGSLVPLAALHPASSFFGIDLARTPVEQGRRRIDALGLANIRLEQMDVMDFPSEAGEFDYIIAHGLFSWVPQQVRERILHLCHLHLAPQGIACISYNTYPGCRIRQMFRDMMLFHTAQFDNPQDKIEQARSIVQLVAHGTQREDGAHRLAKEEAARLAALSDSSLLHDDLAPVWQPFLFHEFVSLAENHGLQYLADSSYADMQAAGITGDAAALLQTLPAGDRIRYQQYLDFFRMRHFRRTLLCRDSVALHAEPDVSSVARFHFSAPLHEVPAGSDDVPAEAKSWRNDLNAVAVTTNNPTGLAVLAAIAEAWPATKSFADMASSTDNPDALCSSLHAYYASGIINAHALPGSASRVAGERPQVWRVARLEAEMSSSIPNLHLGTIELNDLSLRSLLPMFDGMRTRGELEAAVGGHDTLQAILGEMARKALLTA
jgi:SAM-dependent methyltransferase